MKDVGPVLTGIGTLLLSAVVGYYVHTMDKQKQALDAQKTAIEETNLRLKLLRLSIKTPANRDCPITLAAYAEFAAFVAPAADGSADPTISTQCSHLRDSCHR